MRVTNLNSRKIKNSVWRIGISVLSLLGVVSLFLMFGFIIREAIPAYREYNFFNIYFTADFSNGFGIWGSLVVTLFTSFVAILVATPLALRAAIFMKFRIKRGKKVFRILIDILAGVPSVIFGIFALRSLNSISSLFVGDALNNKTIFNATLMLIIMIFPTLVALISNQLDLIDKTEIESAMALGNTKTNTIYKVIKKSIRSGIYVAIIVALGRAIGETMALSIVLATPSANPFGNGLSDFLSSPYATLGSAVASYMFTDAADPIVRQGAIAAGLSIFVVVLFLVGYVTYISRQKFIKVETPISHEYFYNGRRSYNSIVFSFIFAKRIFLFIPKLLQYYVFYGTTLIKDSFNWLYYYAYRPIGYFFRKRNTHSFDTKYLSVNNFYDTKRTSSTYVSDKIRIFFEVISILIISGSVLWIIFDIMIIGLAEMTALDFNFRYNGVMNTIVWTLVFILLSIAIAIPFAIGTAIYLSEYARNKRSGKIIRFFLDSLGGTPSIMFGIFGSIFFLNVLSLNNSLGNTSLIAGALTMVIVILPTFTRSIEQVLITIPNSVREASLALGSSRFETIYKVVLPQATPGIITGVILSMGRIISETAPVFLTLGMSFNTSIGILEQGHTLTTWILNNQVFGFASAAVRLAQSYKFASATIILVIVIIGISYSIQPISKLISNQKLKYSKRKAKSQRLALKRLGEKNV